MSFKYLALAVAFTSVMSSASEASTYAAAAPGAVAARKRHASGSSYALAVPAVRDRHAVGTTFGKPASKMAGKAVAESLLDLNQE